MSVLSFFFFFNDTATTEIYTLSLHDALPIFRQERTGRPCAAPISLAGRVWRAYRRSEEHTSELQSQSNLVCRLLLEKKKKKKNQPHSPPRIPLRPTPTTQRPLLIPITVPRTI